MVWVKRNGWVSIDLKGGVTLTVSIGISLNVNYASIYKPWNI